jgi:hypothetical protein
MGVEVVECGQGKTGLFEVLVESERRLNVSCLHHFEAQAVNETEVLFPTVKSRCSVLACHSAYTQTISRSGTILA